MDPNWNDPNQWQQQANQINQQADVDANLRANQMIAAMQQMKREDRILQLQMAIAQATNPAVAARLTDLLAAEEAKQERDKFRAFVWALVGLVAFVAAFLITLRVMGLSLGDIFGA